MLVDIASLMIFFVENSSFKYHESVDLLWVLNQRFIHTFIQGEDNLTN
jgi:hypothetical protein